MSTSGEDGKRYGKGREEQGEDAGSGISHIGQHIVSSHQLQHLLAFPHLNHNHTDAICYVCAEQYEHHIEPVANVKTSAVAIAYAENCDDGGINASADDVHLSAVGMGRLNVVDAYGDSGDAWGIFRYFAISFSVDY